ncbi:MAG: hypothetical protein LBQ14_04860 [Treponema sp.]|jgi:adenine-specific DNA-methyltransferase|nr:hypothetical protein [Treponema sp.]
MENKTGVNFPELKSRYDEILFNLSLEKLKPGFISELYAPKDENNIRPDDRVFYTVRNAMYIDTARQLIGGIPEDQQKFFIAPFYRKLQYTPIPRGCSRAFTRTGKPA